MSNLAILGGRVLDPGQGLDAKTGVWIDEGIIGRVGPAAAETTRHGTAAQGRAGSPGAGTARQEIDATGLIVTPGLVDLHTHLYPGVSHYGIEPDTLLPRPRGHHRGRRRVLRAPRRSPACAATSSSSRGPGSWPS